MGPDTTIDAVELEEQILTGFYISQRPWASASRVLLDLQTLTRLCQCDKKAELLVEAQRIGLTGTYLLFLSVLDNLPPFLQSLETGISYKEIRPSTQYQRQNFRVQRANLLVTYHCLRMVLLQRFIDLGLASLLRLRDEGVILALRKTEIARDLINVIISVSFDSLRANGEACVSNYFSAILITSTQGLLFSKGNQNTPSRCHDPRGDATSQCS
jgi:hypothetical protein